MKSEILVTLTFSLIFALISCYIPSNTLSAESEIKHLLESQTSSGSFGPDIKSTLYAIQALIELKQPIPNRNKICQFASGLNVSDLESVWYSVEVSSLLNCTIKLPQPVVNDLFESLEGSEEARLWSCRVFQRLRSRTSLSESRLSAEIEKLSHNLEDHGYLTSEDYWESGFLAGQALQALSGLNLKKAATDRIWRQVKKILHNGGGDDSELYYSHRDSPEDRLESTISILKGVKSFVNKFSISRPIFSESQIQRLASLFLDSDSVVSESSAQRILGLSLLSNGPWTSPIVMKVQAEKFKTLSPHAPIFFRLSNTSGRDLIKISVFSVWGDPIENVRVLLTVLNSSNSTLLSSQKLKTDQKLKNLFVFDFLNLKPTAGSYELQVSIHFPIQASLHAVVEGSRHARVLCSVLIEDLEVSVTSPERVALIPLNSKGAPPVVSLESRSQVFKVSYRVTDRVSKSGLSVQQPFVVFEKQTSAEEDRNYVQNPAKIKNVVYFESKLDAKRRYNTDAHTSDLSPGKWKLTLLVGDPYIENSSETVLLYVSVPDNADFGANRNTSSLYDSLDLIHHKFKAFHRETHDVISMTFTALILVPLLVLFAGVLYYEPFSMPLFPAGFGSVCAIVFHVSVGVIVFVLCDYYLGKNIFTTFKHLIFMSPVTFLSGFITVRNVAINRARSAKGE